jgi:hypothetical protein
MDTQQTLNNTENIQMDPLINPPNIVIDGIGDITLEPSVGPYTITNTSAPHVANPSPSKQQDLKIQQKVIQILTTHQSACTYDVQDPRYPKFQRGQD